ncbi:MAG TPA: FeoA family protein [Anaerolineaceae bacterium]|jgi:ferrous iron transport protein A|nr:FeoA family protein [Anaerolineaceae bacterium]
MKTLRDVEIGESARVIRVHGCGRIRRRVMDMGITKNVEIFVRKVAPLGDPIEVNLRGYELSLRKDDAEIIEVSSPMSSINNECHHAHNHRRRRQSKFW